MHGICLEQPLDEWFNFPTPETSISPNYIEDAIFAQHTKKPRPNTLMVWPGLPIHIESYTAEFDDASHGEITVLHFNTKKNSNNMEFEAEFGYLVSCSN